MPTTKKAAPVANATALPDPWRDLRKAVREAHALGAEFRIVGANVEIDGDLPETLRAALPVKHLYQYLVAAEADTEALAYFYMFGVEPVLVLDHAGLEVAIAELSGAEIVAIDIETALRDTRPAPVRINKNGTVAVRQSSPDETGLDPYRADIATVQLYAGGERAFICRGEALQALIKGRWLREQHLVAHNAAFELSFLRHHSRPPEGVTPRHPFECTQQLAGLLQGNWNRSLATTSQNVFGTMPPKGLQASYWAAPRLSCGQIAYAVTDVVSVWHFWQELRPTLESKRRVPAYVLQRNAIGAVVDMRARGLLLDRAEHGQQVEAWSRELTEARRTYLDETGEPAPTTPNEVRAWVAQVAPEKLATWPKTPKGEMSVERKHLKRLILSETPQIKPVLRMLTLANLLSTFGPGLHRHIHPITGRVHCNYKIGGSKSGRFASSDPNLQNLPATRAPEFRKTIIAGPGMVLIDGDWSQIELRAAAWISGDSALNAVYSAGRDLHREVASAIAGVPSEAVTPEQRSAAKPVNFGSIYGVGARTLAEHAFDVYSIDMTLCKRRRENPSVKRPGSPVAPE